MSEEAAFLMALKANPADDTARLVYADWLDDHDQPHMAEYLRAVVDVARAPEDAAATARLLAAVPHADLAWRLEAGSRFALILDGYTDKIRAIKWLRVVTGLGLGKAKMASESLPHIVLEEEPWEVIRDEVAKFSGDGLSARLVPLQGPSDDRGERFAIHARCVVYGLEGSTEADFIRFRTDARAALDRLIQAARELGFQPKETESAEIVFLGRCLTRSEHRRVLAQLKPHVPAELPRPGWGIWLHSQPSS